MKFLYPFFLLVVACLSANAQTPTAVKAFLQNTTQTGTYYVAGNSTAISNNILVNCQKVEYSTGFVYVTTTGVPAYPTGPFQDGNPSNATNQNAIYKIPLNPVQNTGTTTATNPGNIGVFINGVSLFDYRDGVAWNPNTGTICGGPGNTPCPGGMGAVLDWNRDAIPAEKPGFDCAKAHPAMGNYHHHQNPSAFKLDLEVISTVCNLYDSEGLYAIDETAHAPLIGYAYDGFPIYGAYGFKNTDGTGGIARIKSSYQLKANRGTGNVPSTTTFEMGYFREDYEFVAHPGEGDYLDVHNGRFCITPEYPNGIYCYFATVDENWNSTYPYVVGPTFYGVSANRKVTTISEPTTVYMVTATNDLAKDIIDVNVFPNPASEYIVVQIKGLNKENLTVELVQTDGKTVQTKTLSAGTTMSYLELNTVYPGLYFVRITGAKGQTIEKVIVNK